MSHTVIGLLSIELDVPAAQSLKDKRQVIKSVQGKLRNRFNVSVAEVGGQDSRQRAVLAVVCAASDERYAQGLLQKVVNRLEKTRLDCVLVDYQITML